MKNSISSFIFEKIGVPDNKKFLDLASLRHKLISGNIANVSTPGYQSKDIDFKAEFAKATKKTDQLSGALTNNQHIPLGNHPNKTPDVKSEKILENEMNSIDIDKEVSNLAQNELLYTVGAKLMADRFVGLRKAIKGQ